MDREDDQDMSVAGTAPAALPFAAGAFRGKSVLVTGATSGIGEATALAFAHHGASVVALGRDTDRAAALQGRAEAAGLTLRSLILDVTAEKAPAQMVAAALDAFGRLDIAVNNAGYQETRAPMSEQDDAVYDRVFEVNVRAVFRAMKAQIAAMGAQEPHHAGAARGAIINIASVSGVRIPYPGFSLYAASKAALIQMTRAAAMENAPGGIRINTVSPGRVVTPMMTGAGVDLAQVAATLPLRRLGTPEDLAATILWLASDAAGYVVGQNIAADGGFLAT